MKLPVEAHESAGVKIPSKTDCFRLMAETGMLANIVVHSIQVCRVALLLADRLQAAGIELNRDLVEAAALLHDITKTRSLETGEKHAETGGQFLRQRGYPEVGTIVHQHVKLDHYFAADLPDEAEIVNYADKRVLHDRVVSLSRRMAYIVERYGGNQQLARRLDLLWEQSVIMEERIFSHLHFSSEQVADLLPTEGLAAELDDFRAACERG